MVRRLALFLALLAPQAQAYELKRDSTQEVVRWARPAVFVVDAELGQKLGEHQAHDAVQAAIDTLERGTPGLEVSVRTGQTTGVGYHFGSGAQNQSEIVLVSDWTFDEAALAITVLTVDVKTHRILDADIAINGTRPFRVLTEEDRQHYDLQNVLTHELGHAMGLAHNPVEEEAVMYPWSESGELTKRTLSEDDKAGLAFLYPGDEAPEGAAGCSASGANLPALFGLFSLALLFRRARRLTAAAATVAVLGSTAALAEGARADLTRADLVVTGQVLSRRTLTPAPGDRLLRSELTLSIASCQKGPCPREVTVTVPGGRWGDVEQLVEGLSIPEVGAKVGVSIKAARLTGVWSLNDFHQRAAFRASLERARLPLSSTPNAQK